MVHDIYLPGTPKNASPLKQCDGPCCSQKPPEGGIQLSPTRWFCVSCWRKANARKK